MDSLLSAITSASPDRAAQENLKEHLLRNEKVIVRSLGDVDAALAVLAPARCGMAALILLCVRCAFCSCRANTSCYVSCSFLSGCQAENLAKYEFQADVYFTYARRALLEAPRLHIELASSKGVHAYAVVCTRMEA